MGGGGGVAIRIAALAPVLLLLLVPAIPAIADSTIPATDHHTAAPHDRHAKAPAEQSRRETTQVTGIDFGSNTALDNAVGVAAAAQGSDRSALRPAFRRAPKQSGLAAHNRNGHRHATPNPRSTTPVATSTPSTTRPVPPADAAVAPFQPSTSSTRPRPASEPSTPPSSAVPGGHPQPSKKPKSLGSILTGPLHFSLWPLPIAIAIMLAAAGAGLVIMLSRTHRRPGPTTAAVATIGRHRGTRGNRSTEPTDAAR